MSPVRASKVQVADRLAQRWQAFRSLVLAQHHPNTFRVWIGSPVVEDLDGTVSLPYPHTKIELNLLNALCQVLGSRF
jgi:hypothetical protein